MNLLEWKKVKLSEFRDQVKEQIRAGAEITEHAHFSASELEMFAEEVAIEDFNELHEDFEEVSLDEDLEISEEVQDAFEFIPTESGSRMDIETEYTFGEEGINEETIQRIADLFFAEDFEIDLIEEGIKAKIVFKRAKGEVYKKKKCAKGMRLVGNKCLPQTGEQKAGERRRGIKLKRAFKAMGAGKKKKAQIKKKITQRRIKGRARNLANTAN